MRETFVVQERNGVWHNERNKTKQTKSSHESKFSLKAKVLYTIPLGIVVYIYASCINARRSSCGLQFVTYYTQAVNTEHEMWAQLQNATVGLTGNFLANNTYAVYTYTRGRDQAFQRWSAASRYTTAATFISEATRPFIIATCSVQKRENFTIFSIYSITKY